MSDALVIDAINETATQTSGNLPSFSSNPRGMIVTIAVESGDDLDLGVEILARHNLLSPSLRDTLLAEMLGSVVGPGVYHWELNPDGAKSVPAVPHKFFANADPFLMRKFIGSCPSADYRFCTDGASVGAGLRLQSNRDVQVELYEGTTFTAPGTPLVANDFNRVNPQSALSAIEAFPEIDDLGTRLNAARVNVGNDGALDSEIGATIERGNISFILKPRTDYLVRVLPIDSRPVSMQAGFTWQEIGPGSGPWRTQVALPTNMILRVVHRNSNPATYKVLIDRV